MRIVALLLLPALFYYATFVLHFHFLPHSGWGEPKPEHPNPNPNLPHSGP